MDIDKWYINLLLAHISKFNRKKYWKIRDEVINSNSTKPKWLRYYWFYKIKKADAFNGASMGTNIGNGAIFKSPPTLRHGLRGITISHYAQIGANCEIYQHVTIAQDGDNKSAAIIGDNCLIGAGAVILKSVKIGDNVKIGANAVVTKDIPSNSTVVGNPARVINN